MGTEIKPQYTKPKYSESTPVARLRMSSITAYVHSKSDYNTWLNWDPSLCYMEDDAKGCLWQNISGHAACVRKPKHTQKADNDQSNVVNEVVYKPEEEAYKSVLQVTCPKSCTNCQCAGCKNISVPLGKCTAAGQGAGVIGSCSGNGKTFTEQIYLNAKCQGQAATRSDINTDACIETSETHQHCAYFCMKSAAPEDLLV